MPPGDPAAEDWVAVKALAVLAATAPAPLEEITAQADAACVARSRAPAPTRASATSAGGRVPPLRPGPGGRLAHRDRSHRGACRHLIADRLEIGGARWGLDSAEAVLTLRAVISTGTSRSTGASTWPASTSGSTPASYRGSTHSAPDRQPHSKRAAHFQ